MEDESLIIGLGASAGGIQALKTFFQSVPSDSGFAYVVILHLSPEHESKLAEILQVTSPIPVTQVQSRVKVLPNQVYVIPPNRNLALADGHLAVTDMIGPEERRSPVDLFLSTLAETSESRAVAVILSGTGANGSLGLKRVKEHGGIVFAQDPGQAQYADMPRNAIATGLVDFVLPVADIPAKIIAFNKHRGAAEELAKAEELPKSQEETLHQIFNHLRLRTGHDFSDYKRGTILRRIERRVGLLELPSMPAYARYLQENPTEAQELMKDLLISVTNFFRDPQSLKALSENVFTKILRNKKQTDQVRVWIAGCATGEEAYTIAMLVSELLPANRAKLQVFATDLDAEAISVAREGFYTEAEVADISPERLQRFFVKENERYRVKRQLRETVLFATHNLISDPPFSHLDFISCRNLLIYLNRAAQTRVLELLHFALNPNGFLFLGNSESIEGAIDLFSTFDKDHHIFQSRPVQPRTILPVPDVPIRRATGPEPPPATGFSGRVSYLDLHQRLLEQLAPPSVIIDEEYNILHLSGNVGRYLVLGAGEPSKNLLQLVRPELRMELRATLYQAEQSRTNLEVRNLHVNTDDGQKVVNIYVRPVLRESDPTRGFILVLFEESESLGGYAGEKEVVAPAESISRHLESELIQSKSRLRSVVEQYEIQQEELRASNEALQAMNEELRSAAEELETSKEELQSVNEELTTVNQELEVKIEELSQANNDFANLIDSTDIGTIFLDRTLRIKQFTPRARVAFNLISNDLGRSLTDITNKLGYENLLEDAEVTLRTLQTIEREVESREGLWYLMRILPYRTAEDRIEGVVLTFIDISEGRAIKNELLRVQGELEAKVVSRTEDLARANSSLGIEVSQRHQAEEVGVRLLSQVISAQEDERRRLARDLHDQLGQQLTAMRLRIEELKKKTKRQSFLEQIDELLNMTSRLDSDVDFLAWELRPVALDDLGLAEALRNYVAQWGSYLGKVAEFHATGFENKRLSAEVESNLYRIAQEALNNVAKHANSTRVDVILERRDGQAVLIIENDGKGFNESDSVLGLGLLGMRERAALVGGTLELESAHDKGTTIFVRVPIKDFEIEVKDHE
jgi:two-component system CheB/CheR fusion protein